MKQVPIGDGDTGSLELKSWGARHVLHGKKEEEQMCWQEKTKLFDRGPVYYAPLPARAAFRPIEFNVQMFTNF
jgi:hypothetical protein